MNNDSSTWRPNRNQRSESIDDTNVVFTKLSRELRALRNSGGRAGAINEGDNDWNFFPSNNLYHCLVGVTRLVEVLN